MKLFLEGSVALCWYEAYGDYQNVNIVWGVVCLEELGMFGQVRKGLG